MKVESCEPTVDLFVRRDGGGIKAERWNLAKYLFTFCFVSYMFLPLFLFFILHHLQVLSSSFLSVCLSVYGYLLDFSSFCLFKMEFLWMKYLNTRLSFFLSHHFFLKIIHIHQSFSQQTMPAKKKVRAIRLDNKGLKVLRMVFVVIIAK